MPPLNLKSTRPLLLNPVTYNSQKKFLEFLSQAGQQVPTTWPALLTITFLCEEGGLQYLSNNKIPFHFLNDEVTQDGNWQLFSFNFLMIPISLITREIRKESMRKERSRVKQPNTQRQRSIKTSGLYCLVFFFNKDRVGVDRAKNIILFQKISFQSRYLVLLLIFNVKIQCCVSIIMS